MGLNIGKALKKLGGAVTKVASFVPGPIGLIGSAGNAAINKKPIVSSVVGDQVRNSKAAAALLPLALTGGAAGALGAGALGGAASGAAGAAGAAGGAGGFLGGLGGLSGVVDLGLGGLSAYQGYKAQQKADKLQGQALDLAKARDAELAPMRQAAIQKLMSAQRPDLSSDFVSANPFARPLKRLG